MMGDMLPEELVAVEAAVRNRLLATFEARRTDRDKTVVMQRL
jgi:hypothetical protein